MARRSKRGGNEKKPDPYKKQKMLAIPVLLAVLGYVLINNFSGSEDSSLAETDAAPVAVAVRPERTGVVRVNASQGQIENAWPLPTLSFLDGPSPLSRFRAPKRTAGIPGEVLVAEESIGQENQRIEADVRQQLASQSVQFVFKSPTRKIALVGDQIVREGEQLQSGVRLRDVRGKNLVIEVGRQID